MHAVAARLSANGGGVARGQEGGQGKYARALKQKYYAGNTADCRLPDLEDVRS